MRRDGRVLKGFHVQYRNHITGESTPEYYRIDVFGSVHEVDEYARLTSLQKGDGWYVDDITEEWL